MIKFYLPLHNAITNFKKQSLWISLLLFSILYANTNANAQCNVNPVANQVVCNNTATTAINFTGTATTFNWTNNTPSIGLAASGTGNISSFTAMNANATSVTATITVTPSNGVCTGPPVNFTITVNPLPVIVVTRNTTCGGPCNSMTASGADVYTWSPIVGLYTDCPVSQPYLGTNLSTVYTAPNNSNTYQVTGTNSVTGCIKTAMAIPNYVPPAPAIIPPSVSMCLGDPAVKLRVASGNGFNAFCSGTISIPVTDNDPSGAFSNINIAGIPASCTVTGMTVTINMTHTRISDMVFILKAPNGQVLNLSAMLNRTNQAGANFTNTVISSAATNPLGGAAPYTGTFAVDAAGATFIASGNTYPGGPTGMVPTTQSWLSLYSVGPPNGAWTLGFYDGITGETGILTSWCLGISYSCPPPVAAPSAWTPIAGLFHEPAAVVPYINGVFIDSVWARPTPAGVYPYQVTNFTLPMPPVAFSNPSAINIPVGGTASLYSSDLSVYGLPVAGVTVKSVVLNNINHTRSEDIDIVLQSPTGQNVILMSDAGGSNAVNATYTFGNINLGPNLNSVLPNPTGTYRPTNIGLPDNFPAPGPGNISQSSPALSQFIGNMNGTWKLFVLDDDGTANQGVILGGYTINFDLGAPVCPSAPTTVVVTVGQAITITQMPAHQTVCEGGTASFTVGVTGSGPFTYQWQVSTNGNNYTNLVNGGVYSGVNTNTLTIANTTTGMNGSSFRVLISGIGTCASIFTPPASLTVRPLPNIIITASPLIIGPTQTTTIFSTVTPNPAAAYTWYYNNSVLPGAVSSSLLVNYGSPGDYQLRVTDVNGCINLSNIITIANSFALNIYTYPNPSGGIFQVRYFSEPNTTLQRSLTVYNNMGDRIMTRNFTQTIPYQIIDVDVRAHGKGLYWLELRDANGKRLAINRAVVQ